MKCEFDWLKIRGGDGTMLEDCSIQELLDEISRRTDKEEIKQYEEFIQNIGSMILWKDCLFKRDEGNWYSRYHHEEITLKEVLDWLKSYITPYLVE